MPIEPETRMEIELIKKDVNLLTNLFTKFDVTVYKLQEIATSLSKMISIQELRMDAQETASKEIFNILEVRRMDHTSDIKEINGRIDSVNKEFTGKLEDTENKILKEIQELRAEVVKESTRIGAIEILKHTVSGIIVFIAFLLASVSDFMGLFK